MLLGDVLEYNVRRAADRVAVVYGDRRWTYPELAERVRRLSRALAGVAEPRDRVALYAENTPEYVECYYGVPMSGMGLVFVNYRLHPREVVRILADAEPTVVITEPKYLPSVLD